MSEISPEYVSPTTGNGNAVEEFMSLLAEQSTRLDTQQGFVDAVRNELEQITSKGTGLFESVANLELHAGETDVHLARLDARLKGVENLVEWQKETLVAVIVVGGVAIGLILLVLALLVGWQCYRHFDSDYLAESKRGFSGEFNIECPVP